MASTTTTATATMRFLALSLSLILSLSSFSNGLPSSTILDAAEILSNSGHQAMAVNLELASQTLQTHSLTIFAPTDLAFNQIPQLPLSLLRYHLLPHAFSLHSLSSLPYGANIATLLSGHYLTVTTSNHRLSINNVTVHASPLFDDGYLVIFRIHSFFDPYFQIPRTAATCFPRPAPSFSFKEASGVLRSRGFSVMASVLDLQFLAVKDRPDQMTLFAPIDVAMADYVGNGNGNGNLTDYSTVLRRHLVPCKISLNDLVALKEGTLIWSYQRGFTLNVTKSSHKSNAEEDVLLLNGVAVIFPELYVSDWFVVHGLTQVLFDYNVVQDSIQISEAKSSFQFSDHTGIGAHDHSEHYHFSVFH